MFTMPCFIRKNTPKLRSKLTKLGYLTDVLFIDESDTIISTCNCSMDSKHLMQYRRYFSTTCDEEIDDDEQLNGIDCETNEELFLAIAALRDDTDKNQWFTTKGSNCVDEKWWLCQSNNFYKNSLGSEFHKATVTELIRHFNRDENAAINIMNVGLNMV